MGAWTEVGLAQSTTRVTVRNVSPGATPAVGVHASLVSVASGEPVAPILWSDNDVTLFADQQVTLTARHPNGDVRIEVDAFNAPAPISVVAASVVPASVVPASVTAQNRR